MQYDINQYVASTTGKVVDKKEITRKLVENWSITPCLADKLADILVFMADKEEITTGQVVTALGYTETTAKRYLRQLSGFGYLQPHGGNRNRSYSRREP